MTLFPYEPLHGKTNNLHWQKNIKTSTEPTICIGKKQICEADQRLCFRYTDSTIPLLSKSNISILKPSSVLVQPGLCLTWSATQIVGFLTHRLIYNIPMNHGLGFLFLVNVPYWKYMYTLILKVHHRYHSTLMHVHTFNN